MKNKKKKIDNTPGLHKKSEDVLHPDHNKRSDNREENNATHISPFDFPPPGEGVSSRYFSRKRKTPTHVF